MIPGPVTVARDAWGDSMPDWVLRLAQECEATSQSKVAGRLDRSSSLVSNVLRAKYPGDMTAVEDLVRGVLMSAKVACPMLGELPTHECRAWRQRTKSFSGHNALRVSMFRACTRCPRNTGEPT
jgi:hypothetical protein